MRERKSDYLTGVLQVIVGHMIDIETVERYGHFIRKKDYE